MSKLKTKQLSTNISNNILIKANQSNVEGSNIAETITGGIVSFSASLTANRTIILPNYDSTILAVTQSNTYSLAYFYNNQLAYSNGLTYDGTTFYINSTIKVASLTGSSYSMVVADQNGILITQSIPSGATLTQSYIGYGGSTNLLTGDSHFTRDAATGMVTFGTNISPIIGYNVDFDPIVVIARTVDPTINTNGHGFVDATVFYKNFDGFAYNSYTANAKYAGTASYDHYAAFQSQFSHTGSGNIINYYGIFDAVGINNGGNIINRFGVWVNDVGHPSSGNVINQYGLYIPTLLAGTNLNRAIHVVSNPSFFGGDVNLFNLDGTSNTLTPKLGFYHGNGPQTLTDYIQSQILTNATQMTFNVVNANFSTFKEILTLRGDDLNTGTSDFISLNSSSVKVISLSNSGTNMVVVNNLGVLGTQSIPNTRINSNEISYGTGAGITSSVNLTFNNNIVKIGNVTPTSVYTGPLVIATNSGNAFVSIFNSDITAIVGSRFGENDANVAYYVRYGSTRSGTFTSTSITTANTAHINNNTDTLNYASGPLVVSGNPVFNLIGHQDNYGSRFDVNGLRIARASTLHTPNTYQFEVGGIAFAGGGIVYNSGSQETYFVLSGPNARFGSYSSYYGANQNSLELYVNGTKQVDLSVLTNTFEIPNYYLKVGNLSGSTYSMVVSDQNGVLATMSIPGANTIPIPTMQIPYGTGTGITSSNTFFYDKNSQAVTIDNLYVGKLNGFVDGIQAPNLGLYGANSNSFIQVKADGGVYSYAPLGFTMSSSKFSINADTSFKYESEQLFIGRSTIGGSLYLRNNSYNLGGESTLVIDDANAGAKLLAVGYSTTIDPKIYTGSGELILEYRNGLTDTGNVAVRASEFVVYNKSRLIGKARIGDSNLNTGHTLEVAGDVQITSLSGSNNRLVETNAIGEIYAEKEFTSQWVTDTNTRLLLSATASWNNVNGTYIGATISNTFQSQTHYDSDYFYIAVSDNNFIRMARV